MKGLPPSEQLAMQVSLYAEQEAGVTSTCATLNILLQVPNVPCQHAGRICQVLRLQSSYVGLPCYPSVSMWQDKACWLRPKLTGDVVHKTMATYALNRQLGSCVRLLLM